MSNENTLINVDLNPARVGMWIHTIIASFRIIKFNPTPENNIILGILITQLLKTHMNKEQFMINMSNIWDLDERLSNDLEYLNDEQEPKHEDPMKGH